MKIKDIEDLTIRDINNMRTTELLDALAYSKKVLRSRYQRQKTAGYTAPIWKGRTPNRIKTKYPQWMLQEVTRDMSPDLKTQLNTVRNSIINQLTESKQLLNAQTTTVTGYNKWKGHVKNKLQLDPNRDLSEAEEQKIWNIYNRTNEQNPGIKQMISYKEMLKVIEQVVREHQRTHLKTVNRALTDAINEAEGREGLNRYTPGDLQLIE